MEYQLTKEDEILFARIEREENEMLLKYYDLKKSDANCPKNPYLLKPNRLHLDAYQVLTDNTVILKIRSCRNWSGFVSSNVRMNYNQYIFGELQCERVESIKEVNFNKKGTIKIPFFSKSKILNLPIKNINNVKIKCKKIKVNHIDIYVRNNEGKYILDEVYRKDLRANLENNDNAVNNHK